MVMIEMTHVHVCLYFYFVGESCLIWFFQSLRLKVVSSVVQLPFFAFFAQFKRPSPAIDTFTAKVLTQESLETDYLSSTRVPS